ncbi:MAG: hypothetical protein JO269_04675 [Burkholderiaceae bacterium]|nr:hypothetical protein [Burkholderiaceae bacterium]
MPTPFPHRSILAERMIPVRSAIASMRTDAVLFDLRIAGAFAFCQLRARCLLGTQPALLIDPWGHFRARTMVKRQFQLHSDMFLSFGNLLFLSGHGGMNGDDIRGCEQRKDDGFHVDAILP